MSSQRFLQIHFITAFPASLLNRDDAGLAKRMPFGGASRIRISSQCLKRHWRTAQGEVTLAGAGELSVRSRRIFDELIAQPLVADGFDASEVSAVLLDVQKKLLGESIAARRGADTKLETNQLIILGRPEIDYIKNLATAVLKADGSFEDYLKDKDLSDKALRKNLEAMQRGAGLDAALFGRMVTSDILARVDAAVHVAHAFTVHEEDTESDYFTAVDDLMIESDEQGSAHLGDTELTSGVFYGYAVVDLPQLVSNLEGVKPADWESADRKLAGTVVETLIHLIASTSPGAKLGSTAPYSYAHFMMVEAGRRQPRTLANAFLDPVRANGEFARLAVDRLGAYVGKFDEMYGKKEDRRHASLDQLESVSNISKDIGSLDALASWSAKQARGK